MHASHFHHGACKAACKSKHNELSPEQGVSSAPNLIVSVFKGARVEHARTVCAFCPAYNFKNGRPCWKWCRPIGLSAKHDPGRLLHSQRSSFCNSSPCNACLPLAKATAMTRQGRTHSSMLFYTHLQDEMSTGTNLVLLCTLAPALLLLVLGILPRGAILAHVLPVLSDCSAAHLPQACLDSSSGGGIKLCIVHQIPLWCGLPCGQDLSHGVPILARGCCGCVL